MPLSIIPERSLGRAWHSCTPAAASRFRLVRTSINRTSSGKTFRSEKTLSTHHTLADANAALERQQRIDAPSERIPRRTLGQRWTPSRLGIYAKSLTKEEYLALQQKGNYILDSR